MKDLILFNRIVVRFKQCVIITAAALVGGVVKIDMLHLSPTWGDRILMVAILISTFTRPPVYISKKEDN